MSTTSVSKVQINGQTFYIKLDMNANDTEVFKILLMNKDNEDEGWTGTYSYETAKETFQSLYQTENVYMAHIKNCFLGKDNNQYQIDLIENPSDGTATLSWKLRFEDFFQEQGSLKLLRDSNGCKNAIVDFLMADNDCLRKLNERIEQHAEEVKNELELCKVEVAQFVATKISTEDNLYGKFVDLLNSKKKKIQLLEEQLSYYSK